MVVGTPGRVLPAAVPNENVAAVIVVVEVTSGTERVKVVPLSRNGLCGPLPAIDPFAFEYVPPEYVPLLEGPMIV